MTGRRLPAEHARACDCPGCSCVGVSRDYLRTMLEDEERRRARRSQARARWARTLARAVIDLTARLDAERFAHANTAVKVKRVEALADRLDALANELEADGYADYAEAARTDAHSIRAALNGESRA